MSRTTTLHLVIALLAAASSTTPATAQEREKAHLLGPDETVARAIKIGENHQYRIRLFAGQFLRLTVKYHGRLDLLITLFGPDNKKLIVVSSDYRGVLEDPITTKGRALGIESLSFAVEASGEYRLVVDAGPSRVPGRYKLKIDELRIATDQDRKRAEAERLTAEGEQLRLKKNDAASLRQALKKFDEALSQWRALGDAAGEADTLNSIGLVYSYDSIVLRDKKRALSYYERALARWRAAGDLRGEANTLRNMGSVAITIEQALDYFNQSLQRWRDVGDRLWEARLLGEIAGAYSRCDDVLKCGDRQMALDYYERSLQIWQTLDDRAGMDLLLFSLAHFCDWQGERQKARVYYNQALQYALATELHTSAAFIHLRLGETYYVEGEYHTALDYYQRAYSISRGLGNEAEAYTLYDLGQISATLGEKQKALDYFNQALPLWVRNVNGEGYTLEQIGRLYASMGKWREALNQYNRALPLLRSTGDRHGEASIFNDMGFVFASIGESRNAIDYHDRALQIGRAISHRGVEAQTLSYLGKVYDSSGDRPKALDYYTQALGLLKAIGDRNGEAQARYDIARVNRGLGDDARARAEIEETLAIVDSLRTKVAGDEIRSHYFASAQQYYEFYIDLLMSLNKQHPSAGHAATALWASERARSRGLLGLLAESGADIRQGIDPALLERERALRRALNAKADRQMRLLSAKHTPQQAAEIGKEVEALTTEYRQVQADIKAASPRYASLTQPLPLSAQEIQKNLLDSETMLLEYALGDKRSYLWAVTAASISAFELPGRAEIEAAVRRVRELLLARQPVRGKNDPARVRRADSAYLKETARLSRMVLGPVAGLLGKKRLLIVSDGALQYIPFAALPTPGQTPAVPLILDHEIVNVPSASVLATLRQEIAGRKPAAEMIAVLADPVFSEDDPRIKSPARRPIARTEPRPSNGSLTRAVRDVGLSDEAGGISRLPLSRQEAEAIMSLVPAGQGMKAVDFQANRATATSPGLSRYRIVHFATHGLLNSRHPELSGIVLSLVDERGDPQDGFLGLHDVYNLNIPADIVVLSSCQTALGKEVRGEGLIGLVRGFMYAGAARVVASLWKVDDWATSELMKRFYGKLISEGLRPSAALRAAQIEMWKQRRWHAPYYWAAFIIQGEPG
jgi:CHAT domain-containing protein